METENLNGVTMALAKAGLTGISGAATTFSTSACGYAIDGKAFGALANSGAATPTADAVTGGQITLAASQAVIVVWAFDSSGNVRVIGGPVVALDLQSNFVLAPSFGPVALDTYCPFAYTLHKADGTLSGKFTFGSSNWNTTGLTHIVQDLIALPPRPQSS